jgi:serine protease inhibitor
MGGNGNVNNALFSSLSLMKVMAIIYVSGEISAEENIENAAAAARHRDMSLRAAYMALRVLSNDMAALQWRRNINLSRLKCRSTNLNKREAYGSGA